MRLARSLPSPWSMSRQSAVADHGRELVTRADLEHQREAHRADMAALEGRLTWRFAGAMLAQTLAILGGVLAMLRLLE